jgi:hypothetical protein
VAESLILQWCDTMLFEKCLPTFRNIILSTFSSVISSFLDRLGMFILEEERKRRFETSATTHGMS